MSEAGHSRSVTGNLCNACLPSFLLVVMIFLKFGFKQFIFGNHTNFVILMDFFAYARVTEIAWKKLQCWLRTLYVHLGSEDIHCWHIFVSE